MNLSDSLSFSNFRGDLKDASEKNCLRDFKQVSHCPEVRGHFLYYMQSLHKHYTAIVLCLPIAHCILTFYVILFNVC